MATGACRATLRVRRRGHETEDGADVDSCDAEVFALVALDGGRIASGSGDRAIKIWDVATTACVATFEVQSNSVLCLEALEGRRLCLF